VANWDARHSTSAFQLTVEHRKTFVRNKLTFWRHDAIGIKGDNNVDQIALGLMVEHSRTERTKVITVSGAGGFVQSRGGLRLRPDAPAAAAVEYA